MNIQLVKVHGSGNTFYLYEALYDEQFDFVNITQQLCHPSNDGGADGLLIVLPSSIADAKMRVINADGSEASMCGNGLRCVARYVCEKLSLDKAVIETMHACLKVKRDTSIFEELPTYSVEISPISFDLSSLPMTVDHKTELRNELVPDFSKEIPFTAISVPNPHLIGIVDKKYTENTTHQQQLATFLNSENDYCPDGVNVSYVLPLSNDEIFVRTFERGVGFTNACGTAMTASALIASIEGLVTNNKVTVYNPGGFVQCEITKNQDGWNLALIGNATVLGHYEFEIQDGKLQLIHSFLTEEQNQYEKCKFFVNDKIESYM